MKTIKFTIYGRLDNVNDYQSANRGKFYLGNKMKQENQKLCRDAIQLQIKGKHIDYCDVHILWIEKSRRRDHDNISGAIKFILDALVKEGVIKDDGPSYVGNIYHEFDYDKLNPRIEVTLSEPPS